MKQKFNWEIRTIGAVIGASLMGFMVQSVPAQMSCGCCGPECSYTPPTYKVVCETVYDEQKVVTYKPVWETEVRTRPVTVQKQVAETQMREEH
ncbi:MAG: hypothetical protein ACI4UF_05110, partial [Thermoguttaceae bacterium]